MARLSPRRNSHRGPHSRPKRLADVIRTSLLVSAGVLLAQPDYIDGVQAAPKHGNVVAGAGTIRTQNKTTIVNQQSRSLTINWQSFDVAKTEIVRFNQPSSSAAVLNRVLNQSTSQIFGSIQANGKVFIMNPRGVVFGNGARVNVGGLFVTSLDISNDDFMAGDYTFRAADGEHPGAIVNRGLIQAASGGFVALVGGSVSNEGTIVADLGHVHLAAGRKAVLSFDGAGLLHFEVDESVLENVEGAEDAVENSGEIYANGGVVTLSAKVASDVFTRSVNNAGVIQAGQIVKGENGSVSLMGLGAPVSNTGTIDVSAETLVADGGRIEITSDSVIEQFGVLTADASDGDGGSVTLESEQMTLVGGDAVISATSTSGAGGTAHVLGEHVGLIDNASIDVSGGAGGGTALVGGDFQGANPDIANAARTYVGSDATIAANGLVDGDGGKVIVWADEITRFFGDASVQGGAEGGDGGFVEVSGKETLVFAGDVFLSAANGDGGVLLLDPTDINVGAGTNLDGELTGTADPVILFADGAGLTELSVTELTAGFAAGNTIILQASNDITFETDTTLQDGVNLVVQAGNDVTVDTAVTVAAGTTGNIHFEADTPHDGGSDGAGAVVLTGTGTVSTASGDITLIGADFNISGTASVTSSGSGNVNIVSTDSDATNGADTIAIGSGILDGAEIARITTAGTVTIGQATTAGTDGLGAGAATLTAESITVDTAALSVASATAGTFTLIANSGVTFDESVTTDQTTNIDADFDNDGTSDLDISNTFTLDTTGNTLTITANTVELNATGAITSGAAATTIIDSDGTGIGLGATVVAGGVNITDTQLGRITAAGLELQTAGAITVNGITEPNSDNLDTVTLTANGGDNSSVTFSGGPSTFDGLVVVADDGISVQVGVDTDTASLSMDGDANDADDAAGDDIEFTSGITLSSADTLTLTATTGDGTSNLEILAGGVLTLAATTGIDIQDALSGPAGGAATTVTIRGTAAGTAIDVGADNTGADLIVEDAELDRINATTLIIGDTNTDAIRVEALSLAGTATIGTLQLDATEAGGTIVFLDAASLTTGGLALNAADGITITDEDVTVNGSFTAVADSDGGGGTFLITNDGANGNLVLTGSTNSISADFLDVTDGDGPTISAASTDLTIIDANDQGIGLGDTAIGFDISKVDLANITAAGTTLTLQTDAGITVDNLGTGDFTGATGTLVLDASGGAGQILFDNDGSALPNNWNLTLNTAAGGLDVDTTAGITLGGTGALNVNATGGTILVDGAIGAGSGGVTIDPPATVTINNNIITTGNILIEATDNITIDATVQTTGAATSVTVTANQGTADDVGNLSIGGAATAIVRADDGAVVLTGETVSLVNGNASTIHAGNATGTGNVTINADANNNGTTGNVVIGADSTLTVTGDLLIDNAITVDLDRDVVASGGVTISNVVTAIDIAQGVNLTASGGNLDLNEGVALIDLTGAAGINTLSASAEVQLDPLSARCRDERGAGHHSDCEFAGHQRGHWWWVVDVDDESAQCGDDHGRRYRDERHVHVQWQWRCDGRDVGRRVDDG